MKIGHLALLAVMLGSLAQLGSATPTRAQAGPPTVVLIVLDDMRAADWQALSRTQELVGGNGTTFPNFFDTTSQCCPSRASILTGLYAHNHGVLHNGGPEGGESRYRQQGRPEDSLPTWLDEAGYHTGLFGKYLNNYKSGIPPGWDTWSAATSQKYTDFKIQTNDGPQSYSGQSSYATDIEANQAAGLIDQADPNDPLFVYFAPVAPHAPWTPARRHRNAFQAEQVERDPSYAERDTSDKPRYVRGQGRLTSTEQQTLDQRHRQRLRTLLAVDQAVERIWTSLERTGRLGNAYVFVVSDNGYLLGQHNLERKNSPYDGSVWIPMLAFGPGFAAGATDDRIVANIDLAPTIAQAAGATPGHPVDGMSFLDGAERDAILLEFFGGGEDSTESLVPPYRALRTLDQLYVEYDGGECELYDYATDPYELQNRLAGGVEEPAKLATRLSELSGRVSTGCPVVTGRSQPEQDPVREPPRIPTGNEVEGLAPTTVPVDDATPTAFRQRERQRCAVGTADSRRCRERGSG